MATLPSKTKLQEIRQAMQQALDKVAKEHGIDNIKLGNIRYDESGFRVPLEAVFEGGESQELKSLRLNAPLMGFAPEIAGATITYANKQYEVVGLKRTNFLIKDAAGKVYTAKIDMVKHTLKMQKSPLVVEKSFSPSM